MKNPDGLFTLENPLVPYTSRAPGLAGHACRAGRSPQWQAMGKDEEIEMARATSKFISSLAAIMAFELAAAGCTPRVPTSLDRRLTAALHAAGFTAGWKRACRNGWAAPSTGDSPISAGCCGLTSRAGCTPTTPAAAATRPQRLRRHPVDRDRRPEQQHGRPARTGPRNQRRTPAAVNTAFYPNLMWNGRFARCSGDPFDNSAGLPVSRRRKAPRAFRPNDPHHHAPAERAGAHAADGTGRGRRLHGYVQGPSVPSSTSSMMAWARWSRRRTPAGSATSRSARPCSSG